MKSFFSKRITSGQYRKNVKENSNILHLKTLKTFNRFDLNFKIYYKQKNKKI
jgi:hypothetical protein